MALLTNINGKFSVSDAGAVTFNNAFTFPTADGAANYVLQTNGSGQLAWALNGNGDISGSGTANTVTKFTGSKTIGNGPITFSGDNSTFAGSATATGVYTAGNSAIIYKAQRTGGAVAGDWSYDDATTDMSLGTSTAHSFSLKTDNTKALTINNSQNATFIGDVSLANLKSIYLGTSSALRIYTDSAVGYLRGNDVRLTNAANDSIIRVNGDVAELYHNDIKKLETTSTGVTVTNTVAATTFSGDLNGTINTVTTAATKGNSTNDTTVATTAFVQNVVGTIPAGLVFQGTWNANTNTPTLTSGSGTTGNFYIVSVAGSTNLDGITDWQVGDWAVFIEQGASDQWEKIDNSSVLGGSGTGGSFAGWSGSGTSVTLGNAPVTFSGNNSTFAGNVTVNSDSNAIGLRVNGRSSDDIAEINMYENDGTTLLGRIQTRTTEMNIGSITSVPLYLKTNGTTALTLDTSQNATFAGSITGTSANLTTSGTVLSLDRTGGATALVELKIGGTVEGYLGATSTKSLVVFNQSAAEKFSVSNAGDGTFAGNIEMKSDASNNTKFLRIWNEGTATNDDAVLTWQTQASRTYSMGIHRDSGNLVISSADASVASLELITINTSGNATFAGNVSVIGSAKFIEVGSVNTGTNFGFMGWNAASKYLFLGNSYNSAYNEDLVIDSSGNVKVGRSSGYGSSRIQSFINNTANFASSSFLAGDSTNMAAGVGGEIVFTGKYASGVDDYAFYGGIKGFKENATDNNTACALGFYTRPSGTLPTEKMRIDSSGNVGIGTTSPDTKLMVSGEILSENSNGGYFVSTRVPSSSSRPTLNFYGTALDINYVTGYAGSGASTAVSILTNGNVGIGTTSPTSRLSISGLQAAIDITRGNSGDSKWEFSSDSTGLYFSEMSTGTRAYMMTIKETTGNVGIGTTSPAYQLTVSKNSGFHEAGLNTFQSSAGAAHQELRIISDAHGGGGRTGDIAFYTANSATATEKMRITSGGNVGIGVTNPDAKLEIKGTGASTGLTFKTTDSSDNETFYIKDGGVVGVRYYPFKIGVPSGTANVTNTRFQIATTAGDFVVLNDGKTGIGTTTPSNKLDVKISTGNRTTLEPVLTVSAEGSGPYTGFGPKISFNSNIYYGAATGNPAGIIETAYIGAVMGTTYATNSDLVFATRDGATSVTEKMRILGNGNVGIGTTSPSGKFHVKVGTSTPLIVSSNSYCNNVGIRTTTPTASLQVKGNISYSYVNYTNVANTWINVISMAGYPTGLYQISIIKKTNASTYVSAIIKWDSTASASTAGTIVNTITSNQLGVGFNGSTTLQAISGISTGTLMSANLKCLVMNEDYCS